MIHLSGAFRIFSWSVTTARPALWHQRRVVGVTGWREKGERGEGEGAAENKKWPALVCRPEPSGLKSKGPFAAQGAEWITRF